MTNGNEEVLKSSEDISKSASSNFGKWGWFIIVFSFLSFMFAGNLILDSQNIALAAFEGYRGWSVPQLLAFSTPAGIISIVGCLALGAIMNKYGAKFIITISMIIALICCVLWGRVNSIWAYFVILIVINLFTQGFGFMGISTLVANWFPRKKGLALGWATIGFQASSFILIPIFTYIMNPVNASGEAVYTPSRITTVYDFMAILLAILIVVCVIFIKDHPEDRGANPDNDKTKSPEFYKKLHEDAMEYAKTSEFTFKKLVATPQMWHIGISMGLIQLCVTCLIVQFIPAMMASGIDMVKATFIWAGASILGGVFSYLWGVVDQKLGSKTASICIAFAHALAAFVIALAIWTHSPALIYLGAFLVGTEVGASSNIIGSLTGKVFGRYDFANAFTGVYMVNSFVRQFAFLILSVLLAATGTYAATYACAGAVAVIAGLLIIPLNDKCIGRNE